jgi:hypothetical protein
MTTTSLSSSPVNTIENSAAMSSSSFNTIEQAYLAKNSMLMHPTAPCTNYQELGSEIYFHYPDPTGSQSYIFSAMNQHQRNFTGDIPLDFHFEEASNDYGGALLAPWSQQQYEAYRDSQDPHTCQTTQIPWAPQAPYIPWAQQVLQPFKASQKFQFPTPKRQNQGNNASMPTAPKVIIPRPKNAWIIYRQAVHKMAAARNPGLTTGRLSKVISKQWNTEPADVRAKYKQMAEEEKRVHMEKYQGYTFKTGIQRKTSWKARKARNSSAAGGSSKNGIQAKANKLKAEKSEAESSHHGDDESYVTDADYSGNSSSGSNVEKNLE